MRIGAKCLLVLALLYSSAGLAAPMSGMRVNAIKQAVASSGKGVLRLTQAAAFVAATLLAVAPVNAQELLEAEEIQWLDVAEAHHSATIALQSVPAEDERPRLHTLAYIGNTDRGNAVLAGLTLRPLGGFDMDVSYTAYGTDGMLADDVRIEELATFDIDFEGFSETTVLVAKGLSLAGLYEPLSLRDFPLDDVGGELSMVTYWRGKEEAELPFPTSRLRSCSIGKEIPGWGQFGIGLSTCSPTTAYGSLIFYGDRVVGFHGGPGKELIFVEGISDGLLKFTRGIQGKDIMDVEPRHKLPIIWAELKQQR